jgi:hypothetical protein
VSALGRILLLAGGVLMLLGALLLAGGRVPFLSFLGRLPGDLRIERPGFALYVPLTSSLLVSVALTVLLRILFRR